jgi:hypothetical protein
VDQNSTTTTREGKINPQIDHNNTIRKQYKKKQHGKKNKNCTSSGSNEITAKNKKGRAINAATVQANH